MAKYTVIQPFTDKNTGKEYGVGDSYPANVKKDRINELLGDELPHHDGAVIALVDDK